MKKVLIMIMFAGLLFTVGCEDGKDGVMGLTGPSGFDKLVNPNAELTDEQIVQKGEYSKNLKGPEGKIGLTGDPGPEGKIGLTGDPGPVGCDSGKTRDQSTGICG